MKNGSSIWRECIAEINFRNSLLKNQQNMQVKMAGYRSTFGKFSFGDTGRGAGEYRLPNEQDSFILPSLVANRSSGLSLSCPQGAGHVIKFCHLGVRKEIMICWLNLPYSNFFSSHFGFVSKSV